MIGDMTEALIYSQNNHKHCTNATTCLVSAAGCLPGARRLAVCLRGGSLGSHGDCACSESGDCMPLCASGGSGAEIISNTRSEMGQDTMS